MNRLINNRATAQQLFLIVCELAGREAEISIIPNVEVINELKAELYRTINYGIYLDPITGAKEFDLMFVKNIGINKIEPMNDLSNNFDTDLSNSIFNHIETEEAYLRGEVFFNEYLKYNNFDEVKEPKKYFHKPKEVYRLPEIEF